MEDPFRLHTQAVWILLSGISLLLALLMMIFLTVNCLWCFRKQAARGHSDDTEHLLYVQDTSIVEDGNYTTVSQDHSSTTMNQLHNQLKIDHLQELLNKLHPARHKWNNIGVQLGMVNDLDAIKQENHNDSDACLREMLKIWLRGKATRQTLITALKSRNVNYPDIAANLASHGEDLETNVTEPMNMDAMRRISAQPGKPQSQRVQTKITPDKPEATLSVLTQYKDFQIQSEDETQNIQSVEGFECPYCGICSLKKYLKRECPKCHSAFPFLDTHKLTKDEMLIMHTKLMKEANDVIDKFNCLFYQMTKLILTYDEMPNGKLREIANFVNHRLSIFSPSSHVDANAIIHCLKEASSVFNYHNVQRIMIEFGTDEDKESLIAYESSFKKFCDRSVFEVPVTVFGSPPDDGEMLVFKVTDPLINKSQINFQLPHERHDHDKESPLNHPVVTISASTLQMSLNDALEVQMKVAEVLGIDNLGNLVFVGASKGCIELKFSISSVVLNKVKEQHSIKTLTELPGFAELEAANIHILCGPPGKPYAINVTSNSIRIQWSKPEYQGFHPIQYYSVLYQPFRGPPIKWRTVHSKASVEILEIGGLPQNESPFIFRVQAVNEIGTGVLSEISDPIDLMQPILTEVFGDIPSKPGKPQALSITHDSVQLEWAKPEKGVKSITSYTILYRSQFNDPPNQWMENRTASAENTITVLHLFENTTYLFQVLPECGVGIGLESDVSDPITTKMNIPSKPGKPRAKNISFDCIELEWSKPDQGAHNINSYHVFHRSLNDSPDQWIEQKTEGSNESVTVSNLVERTIYSFKVQPECADGVGLMSDVSEPITTKMIIPSEPGKPKASKVSHNSVELEWTKPEQGAHNVTSYSVLYRLISDPADTANCHPPDQWAEQTCTMESSTVCNLNAETTYIFKVRVHCEIGVSEESETSNPIKTKPSLALKLKRESQCIIKQREGLDVYKLPLTALMPKDHKHAIAKYCIGDPQDLSIEYPERVLMIVGATGSGKSTLIDGIANYIMGVKLEDNFRYKLIVEEINQGQACNQTQAIIVYSFPAFDESPLPYKLTVVDTPGFGDTRGLERDEQITAQIKHFFSLSSSEGIDHVDGIGFVIHGQSLTPKYIVDTILSVFSKDIASNIFMITTFAHVAYPPAMVSIKTHIRCANPPIPINIDELQLFKFNNSFLFTRSSLHDGFDNTYWEMGYKSFHDLFSHLGQAIPQTLKLTKSVLDEQKTLQTLVQSVLRHTCKGANSLKELLGAIEAWKDNDAKLRANENFTYEVKVPDKQLEEGVYVVNCRRCIRTCLPSWTTSHGDVQFCPVMDSSGFCTVCPGQCHYIDHVKKNKIKFVYEEIETRTDHELEEKYRNAKQDKADVERLILEIQQKVTNTYERVCICFNQVQYCLERLEKRALRPNPLTDLDYLDILVDGEKQEKSLGWEKRIIYYEKARKSAEIIHFAKNGKLPQHMNLEAIMNDLLKDIPREIH